MNLENIQNQKNTPPAADDFLDEFDFKPITSGLGFHQPKTQDIKPVFTDKPVMSQPVQAREVQPKSDMNVYQNDLSMFYGQNLATEVKQPEMIKEEKVLKIASKTSRVFAYLFDLVFIGSTLSVVLTVMARTISMDLLEVWQNYPAEITPLVLTLFCGFYLIYFSIFEKTAQSTLGKSVFNLRVMTINNKTPDLLSLMLRTAVSLLNFLTLGLFSYFDLQNKVTDCKVVRTK